MANTEYLQGPIVSPERNKEDRIQRPELREPMPDLAHVLEWFQLTENEEYVLKDEPICFMITGEFQQTIQDRAGRNTCYSGTGIYYTIFEYLWTLYSSHLPVAIPRSLSAYELLAGYDPELHILDLAQNDIAENVKRYVAMGDQRSTSTHRVEGAMLSRGPYAEVPSPVSPLDEFNVTDEQRKAALDRLRMYVEAAKESNELAMRHFLESIMPVLHVLPLDVAGKFATFYHNDSQDCGTIEVAEYGIELVGTLPEIAWDMQEAIEYVCENQEMLFDLVKANERGEVLVNYTTRNTLPTREQGSAGWWDGGKSWVIQPDGQLHTGKEVDSTAANYLETWHIIQPEELVVKWSLDRSTHSFTIVQSPPNGISDKQREAIRAIEQDRGFEEDSWGLDPSTVKRREDFINELKQSDQFKRWVKGSEMDPQQLYHALRSISGVLTMTTSGGHDSNTYNDELLPKSICGRGRSYISGIKELDFIPGHSLYYMCEIYQGVRRASVRLIDETKDPNDEMARILAIGKSNVSEEPRTYSRTEYEHAIIAEQLKSKQQAMKITIVWRALEVVIEPSEPAGLVLEGADGSVVTTAMLDALKEHFNN